MIEIKGEFSTSIDFESVLLFFSCDIINTDVEGDKTSFVFGRYILLPLPNKGRRDRPFSSHIGGRKVVY